MMLEWLRPALDWLKTPAKYFLPLLLASAFGLFAPLDAMEFLGIAFWRAEGKPYLGSIFIISLAVTGTHYAAEIVEWLSNKYRKLLALRAAQSSFKYLTPEEKEFLSWYLQNNSVTRPCWIHNTTAAVLRTKGILFVAVEQGPTENFPFTIYPWAWEYLKRHQHLVLVERVE